MAMLAEHPKTIFVGQSVKYPGQRAHATFSGVPMDKRIEMPICEDFTVGFCTGMALEGYIPVCFIPRWDFLLLAANQIINHLDKISLFGDFNPRVIIRTSVGTNTPLDPGPQHVGNYTYGFREMRKTLQILELRDESCIFKNYQLALELPKA